MELVGQILKQNREIKNLSLKNISNELKISEEILYNIENSHPQDDIDRVFIIGHLRSYCSFLDLNQTDLIDQFKKENILNVGNKIEIERPKFESNFLFSNKVFSFSLILVIFTTFYFLFISVDKPSREYSIIPDLPENYISVIEKAGLENITKKINIVEGENFAKLENIASPTNAIASLPKNKDSKPSIITLKFLDDTWVQLRDRNDEIILSKLMNKNDEYSYELESNYSITSGNAGHILVLINQKIKGKIGKKGQVVDSFVLNKDFNN